MMYATPVLSDSEKIKMKKNVSGPRVETLMIISQFARIYTCDPEQKQKVRKEFLN